jgi:hypothetical protein
VNVCQFVRQSEWAYCFSREIIERNRRQLGAKSKKLARWALALTVSFSQGFSKLIVLLESTEYANPLSNIEGITPHNHKKPLADLCNACNIMRQGIQCKRARSIS